MKELLEKLGWKEDPKYVLSHLKRTFYEKGNYWLVTDENLHYTKEPFIELMTRDPALEGERVGDNRNTYYWAFKYKGPQTIEDLEKLLIF